MNSRKLLVPKRIVLPFCREYQDGFLIFFKNIFSVEYLPIGKKFAYC
jgi:hypothetical protein